MRRIPWIALALILAVSACSPSSGTSSSSSKEKSSQKGVPLERCHPGCFPSGTLVVTPNGPRPIDFISRRDVVTLVDSNGVPMHGVVDGTFQTRNRLVQVRTDSGNLLTTETQPLCLLQGGFSPASELKVGDQIWRWEGGQRRSAQVRAVVSTSQEVPVFNLVVGKSAIFVAGGFLVRGKPPVVDGDRSGEAE